MATVQEYAQRSGRSHFGSVWHNHSILAFSQCFKPVPRASKFIESSSVFYFSPTCSAGTRFRWYGPRVCRMARIFKLAHQFGGRTFVKSPLWDFPNHSEAHHTEANQGKPWQTPRVLPVMVGAHTLSAHLAGDHINCGGMTRRTIAIPSCS